jgi:hypothetical protein
LNVAPCCPGWQPAPSASPDPADCVFKIEARAGTRNIVIAGGVLDRDVLIRSTASAFPQAIRFRCGGLFLLTFFSAKTIFDPAD